MQTKDKILDTFENPQLKEDYLITMEIPEFTCLCPLTGQPDFAEFVINYVPDKLCVELKSLKLYMVKFHNSRIGHFLLNFLEFFKNLFQIHLALKEPQSFLSHHQFYYEHKYEYFHLSNQLF